MVELKDQLVTRSVKETDALPHYKEWLEFGNVIQQLSNALEETGAEPTFAEHPFSKINENIFNNENPQTVLENLLLHSRNLLTDITSVVKENSIPPEHTKPVEADKEPGAGGYCIESAGKKPITCRWLMKAMRLQESSIKVFIYITAATPL